MSKNNYQFNNFSSNIHKSMKNILNNDIFEYLIKNQLLEKYLKGFKNINFLNNINVNSFLSKSKETTASQTSQNYKSDLNKDHISNNDNDYNIKYNLNKNNDLTLLQDELSCKEDFMPFHNENLQEELELTNNFCSKDFKSN